MSFSQQSELSEGPKHNQISSFVNTDCLISEEVSETESSCTDLPVKIIVINNRKRGNMFCTRFFLIRILLK